MRITKPFKDALTRRYNVTIENRKAEEMYHQKIGRLVARIVVQSSEQKLPLHE